MGYEMRVERITDMTEVIKCLPFEAMVRRKGRETARESKMLLFIQSVIENPFFGYFIVYDEDEVAGYAIGMLVLIPEMERLSILRMVALTKEVRLLLESALATWAKESKVDMAQITTSKNIKAFKRKWGFKVVSVNLERRI